MTGFPKWASIVVVAVVVVIYTMLVRLWCSKMNKKVFADSDFAVNVVRDTLIRVFTRMRRFLNLISNLYNLYPQNADIKFYKRYKKENRH